MTEKLIVYSSDYIEFFLRRRQGESKLGENIGFLDATQPFTTALKNHKAQYVLLGLPEDIGIRANLGRGGAHTAWDPFLQFFLNIQSNAFIQAEDLLLLGHIDFTVFYDEMNLLDLHFPDQLQKARAIVEKIDDTIYPIIQAIVEAGKIPIVIGGGHNNAFPILKGVSKAKKRSINALNIDPHTDLRMKEGRHSGNGFRYAMDDGYLEKYAVFGMHENYVSQSILEWMNAHSERCSYRSFEAMMVRKSKEPREALNQLLSFVADSSWGLEIDMDSVQNFPSSARTSSGWLANDIRQWMHQSAIVPRLSYVHISEAAPVLAHKKADIKTGKLLSYMVSDFLKAQQQRT